MSVKVVCRTFTFVTIILISIPVLAVCRNSHVRFPVDKTEQRELQRVVNDGHQPWRLDAAAVAGSATCQLTSPNQHCNDYDASIRRIRGSDKEAVFELVSGGNTYRVTVKRFQWLLSLAKRWDWMIWTATDAVVMQCGSPSNPLVVVTEPTVIAFFPPVTDAELKTDPNTAESFADFQLYSTGARERFRKARVTFHELQTRSFRVRVGQAVTTFHPDKAEVGYYLVAPGKKPLVKYGVMTDADLFHLANEYFHLDQK